MLAGLDTGANFQARADRLLRFVDLLLEYVCPSTQLQNYTNFQLRDRLCGGRGFDRYNVCNAWGVDFL